MAPKPIKIKLFIALAAALVICLLLSFPIFWFMDAFCIYGYLPHPKLGPPDYITDLWPSPGSELSLDCYTKSLSGNTFSSSTRGIEIGINTDSIADQLLYDSRHGSFPDRVSLYLDGREIPKSPSDYSDLGPALLSPNGKKTPYSLSKYYNFSWVPPLDIGNHVAKLTIITQSGKLLEYEWRFTIK